MNNILTIIQESGVIEKLHNHFDDHTTSDNAVAPEGIEKYAAQIKAARKRSIDLGMVNLHGTAKQKQWAVQIRDKRFDELDDEKIQLLIGGEFFSSSKFWIDTVRVPISKMLPFFIAMNQLDSDLHLANTIRISNEYLIMSSRAAAKIDKNIQRAIEGIQFRIRNPFEYIHWSC